MSDSIPFELQELIIYKLPVEPLIRFRTVCKAWKSLIDSSDFIQNHIKQQQQQQHLPVRKAVIWNPSIRKAVDVVLPHMADDDDMYRTVLGFGVCRETRDPKIVKIRIDWEGVIPWQVEVFTLSARVWRGAYSGNVPSKFVGFGTQEQVVVGGVVYWIAGDMVDRYSDKLLVMFDLTSEELGEVKLLDRFAPTYFSLSLFKLKQSVAVIELCLEDRKRVYHVWRMKDGVPKLFEKLFTISGCSPNGSTVFLRGFRKTGEAVIQVKAHPGFNQTLAAYEPYSKAISYLGIYGRYISVRSYTETLLLL